ncbi:hypothetical protein BH09BAC1_BH09BAC1_05250 [soil metagenome]
MENILDSNEQPINMLKYRRGLLPWWIKFFCWVFMVFGALILPMVIMSILGMPTQLALYGMESTTVFNIQGALITGMFFISGIVGFGLFYAKDWAITAGLILCAIHVAFVVAIIAFPLTSGTSKVRLEFILVIPFFIKLLKLKQIWQGPQNISLNV